MTVKYRYVIPQSRTFFFFIFVFYGNVFFCFPIHFSAKSYFPSSLKCPEWIIKCIIWSKSASSRWKCVISFCNSFGCLQNQVIFHISQVHVGTLQNKFSVQYLLVYKELLNKSIYTQSWYFIYQYILQKNRGTQLRQPNFATYLLSNTSTMVVSHLNVQ